MPPRISQVRAIRSVSPCAGPKINSSDAGRDGRAGELAVGGEGQEELGLGAGMYGVILGMMGIGGVEYHGHTWELGPRKAKEMLFTSKPVSAEEAEKRGMVNRVIPLADLDAVKGIGPATLQKNQSRLRFQ